MLSTILSIFLFLLKLIGWILLFILALILIILLVPIRYHFAGTAHQNQPRSAQAGVSWFLSLIRFRIEYKEKNILYELKILFFTLKSNQPDYINKKKARKKQKREKLAKKQASTSKKADLEVSKSIEKTTATDSTPEVSEKLPEENTETVVFDDNISEENVLEDCVLESNKDEYNPTRQPTVFQAENMIESPSDKSSSHKEKDRNKQQKEKKKEEKKQKRNSKKSRKEPAGKTDRSKPSRIEQLKENLQQAQSFMEEYQIKSLIQIGKEVILRLIHHIFPGKLEGFLHYGFEDPALTGKVLGFAAMFYPLYGKSFDLQPDFMESCIEGDFKGRGRIRIGFILWILITLLLKKEVRKMIRYILK